MQADNGTDSGWKRSICALCPLVHGGYTDMRKQLDGLMDIIRYSFQLDLYSNSDGSLIISSAGCWRV